MQNDNKLKDQDVFDFVDRVKLYKSAKDRELNDAQTQRFLESIMSNYYLDNDNINFLQENGMSLFEWLDDEKCFCFSGKDFANCCKNKMLPKGDNYVSYVESLASTELYKDHLKLMDEICNEVVINTSCYYPECGNESVLNNLYLNEDKDVYVSSVKKSLFDSKYEMGKNFFEPIESNCFTHNSFCNGHNEFIVSLEQKFDNESALIKSFAIAAYEFSKLKTIQETLREEFIRYYNSIESDGFKAYMVASLKKQTNNLKAASILFDSLRNCVSQKETNNFKVISFELNKQSSLKFKGFVYPQVTPVDYKLVNSVNNVLLTPNVMIMNVCSTNKNSIISFVINKNDNSLIEYMHQWEKKLVTKDSKQSFVTNTALILGDNILLNQKWFIKHSHDEKVLYSALNKFRYEDPGMGQEYIKMKFFAGFDKGNNFF